jgi:hypothetical protein
MTGYCNLFTFADERWDHNICLNGYAVLPMHSIEFSIMMVFSACFSDYLGSGRYE